MKVGVVESGHHEFALQVDDLSLRARRLANLIIRAYFGKAAIDDAEGLRSRALLQIDNPIHEDQFLGFSFARF